MVKLTRIYTRGGDNGETSLGGGKRVAKHSRRIAAVGTVDEANAAIGMARLHMSGESDAMLARIQNDLFDLGADLCRPKDPPKGKGPPLRIVQIPTHVGPGAFGAKMAGELTNAPVPPAVANAVADAVGVRVRELPITAERVHAGLRSRGSR